MSATRFERSQKDIETTVEVLTAFDSQIWGADSRRISAPTRGSTGFAEKVSPAQMDYLDDLGWLSLHAAEEELSTSARACWPELWRALHVNLRENLTSHLQGNLMALPLPSLLSSILASHSSIDSRRRRIVAACFSHFGWEDPESYPLGGAPGPW